MKGTGSALKSFGMVTLTASVFGGHNGHTAGSRLDQGQTERFGQRGIDKDTFTQGREKTLGDYQSWLPLAGANGMMIGNYLTTKGRDLDADLKMLEQGSWI